MSKYQAWKSFEQQIVQMFKSCGFKKARRNWDSQFKEKDTKDLVGTGPYVIQCKYGKRPNLIKAYKEAKKGSKEGEIPVGICRFSKTRKTYCVLSLKDFKWLVNLNK